MKTGILQNPHQICNEDSKCLEFFCGVDYYKDRMFFDDSFENGKRFQYAALNIGGLGPGNFGEFSVIFNIDKFE